MIVHRGEAPTESWVEIDAWEVFTLDQGEPDGGRRTLEPGPGKTLVMALSGEIVVQWSTGQVTLKRRNWLELPRESVRLTSMRTEASVFYPCEVAVVQGTWGIIESVAAFQFRPDKPLTPHYHDYNEYWLIYRGHPEALEDGSPVQLHPGDMLATPAGQEHGMSPLTETVEGIGFETELKPGGRPGHLHREEPAA